MSIERDEEGIHLHCLSCYSVSCCQFAHCPMMYCSSHCGVQFHACKQNDHLEVCREHIRPCINNIHGCPYKVTSILLLTHLEHCPANIIYCGMNWNRTPLHSKVREQWLPFHCGNPVGVVGDLDTEFAIADQERLKKEYKHRMSRGARRIKRRETNGRICKERKQKLERLLTGGCRNSEKVNNISGNNDSSNTEDVDEDFHTCDHLFSESSHEAENKDHVSNTNIRDAYFEVPNTFIYGGNFKQQIITRSLKYKEKARTDANELTEEERTNRLKALSGLNLSTYPLGFNVTLECLPSYFTQYPLYRITCSALLRRDQYGWHCKNSHCDIGMSLNGWLLHRCPLAQYGCPFFQMRLKPKGRTIRFTREFSCFATNYDNNNDSNNNRDDLFDTSLLDLPTEVLVYLMCYLDNLSLNCMAKTCSALRKLCYSMVGELGMVVTTWCKKSYEESGTSSWKEGKTIRSFSTSTSPIRKWTYNEIPNMGQHLKTCAFFKRNILTEKTKLLLD